MTGERPRRLVALAAVGGAVVVVLAVAQIVALVRHVGAGPPAPATEEHGVAGLPALLADTAPSPGERTVDVYAGYGTWVDIYDFVPAADPSRRPAVGVAAIDEMVRQGVRTLYLQAAQLAPDFPGLVVDRAAVAQMLVRAQRAGLEVVGWYLPRFGDIDRDLEHLRAIADFEVLGHRFDGIAVDIEWTEGIADHAERSSRLVELSERLREARGSEAIGAVVLPPVQTEVINPAKWPDFPWRELAGLYDVWLPMAYWTERQPDSAYRDGAAYTEESVRRLRNNLGDDDAPVHAIGGIGDEITSDDVTRFLQAVDDVGAIGGSIYDWRTLDRRLHAPLAARINSGEG